MVESSTAEGLAPSFPAFVTRLRSLLLLSSLGCFGCPTGSELEDPNAYVSSAACDAHAIFERSCDGSACHETVNGSPPLGGVDLVRPGAENRLYNVPASYEPPAENCPSPPELLIDPAGTNISLLITKLTGNHACGNLMPVGPYQLSQPEIDCVTKWAERVIEENLPHENVGGSGGLDAP